MFEKICPDEEFLQAVPNPEDIILDDFLQDGNQNAGEPVGGAQADVVEPGSGEEESPAVETGDSAGEQPSDERENLASLAAEEQADADGTSRHPGEEGDGLAPEAVQEQADGDSRQTREEEVNYQH